LTITLKVPAVVAEAINNAGLTVKDVDWLLLHQANIRIMEHAADVNTLVLKLFRLFMAC